MTPGTARDRRMRNEGACRPWRRLITTEFPIKLSVWPIHVMETDGSIVLKGPIEARDQVLIRIPETQKHFQQEENSHEYDP